MKLIIASDIHGSAYWCRKLLELVEQEVVLMEVMVALENQLFKIQVAAVAAEALEVFLEAMEAQE